MKRAQARKAVSDDRGSQQALIAAMMRPEFYPKLPPQIIHKETHISHIFLAGESVYKVKKPVRFAFLDFSTLAKRRHFLQEELRLNRRLAPSVYLGVMPIGFDDGGWRLGGWSEPAEYTLVMRRLPDKRMLDFLLETQQVTVSMMKQLADHLAVFHAAAEPLRGVTADAHWSLVRDEWTENLTELNSLLATASDRRCFELIRSYGEEFLSKSAISSGDAWRRAGFVTCTATFTPSTYVLPPKEFKSSTVLSSVLSYAAAISLRRSHFC